MAQLQRIFCSLFILLLVLTSSGCQRSMSQVSEDTKSARQHSGKAVKSLGGKRNGVSRQVQSDEEFGWTYDQDGFAANSALDAQNAQGNNYLNPGEPASGIPAYEVFQSPASDLEAVFQKIYFGTNDDVVRGKENLSKAYDIAHYLKTHPKLFVFVEGHCDARGAASYNLSLGARRANSLRNLLIEQGIEPSRLFTITYGKEKPSKIGHSEAAWRWNRRTEYKLYSRK
jgi:peptidoglycan-associated lipoprotein